MFAAYKHLHTFVRTHPYKTGIVIALQVIWLSILTATLVAYLPGVSEDIVAYNRILIESGVEDIDTLGRLAGRESEVLSLKHQLDTQIMRMLFIILGTWTIMNAFFFGIVLKKLTLSFVGMSILIQAGAQLALIFLFSTIVDIRTTIGYDQGFWSLVVFVCVWLVVHLVAWMFIAKRKKKKFTNVLRNSSIWGVYAVGQGGFFLGIVLSHIPIINGWSGGLLLSLVLLIITIAYGTFCKIATLLLIDGTRG